MNVALETKEEMLCIVMLCICYVLLQNLVDASFDLYHITLKRHL